MAEKLDILHDHVIREDKRLDRIEAKIDKLAETVISLARAEEKLISLESDRIIINDRLNKHSDRMDEIETKADNTSITIKVINKIFWIVITGVTAAYTATFFLK